jgi:hypothetical protein
MKSMADFKIARQGDSMTSEEVEKVKKLINNSCWKLIKQGRMPKRLLEDAKQEAWIPYLEGENIMTHLVDWIRKEKYQNKVKSALYELKKPTQKIKSKFNKDEPEDDDVPDFDAGFTYLPDNVNYFYPECDE